MRHTPNAAAHLFQRSLTSGLNAEFREKQTKSVDDPLQVQNDGSLPESVYQRALRLCHQECFKEAQSRLAETSVEYEERLVEILKVAMANEQSRFHGNLGTQMHISKSSTMPLGSNGNTAPVFVNFTKELSSLRNAEKLEAGKDHAEITFPLTQYSEQVQMPLKDAAEGSPLPSPTPVLSHARQVDPPKKPKERGVLDFAADAADLLGGKVYKVENFYKASGWPANIARNVWFGDLTLFIISCNAVYLGIDADFNRQDNLAHADWPWILCENLFCVFFTTEIVVRFLAFESKLNCLVDGWFKFDSTLVILMIFEVWGLFLAGLAGAHIGGLPTAPLRLMRLMRLTRMVRLMRSLPELVTMIKGMRTASRAVVSSLLMVLLLVYVFAIIILMMCQPLVQGDDELAGFLRSHFGRLGPCIWTLLMDGSFMMEPSPVLMALRDTDTWIGYLAIVVFMMFVLLTALTVLNMLIGVLCEVVSAVGQNERDEADVRLVKQGILKELHRFDEDGDGTITQVELEHVMNSKKAIAVLEELQVDKACLDEIHGMLFTGPTDSVGITTILETCLMYRGSQPPTVKHLVDVMVFNREFMTKVCQDCTAQLTRTVIHQNQKLHEKFCYETIRGEEMCYVAF